MKKYIVRKEFFKLKIKGHSYSECQRILEERFERKYGIRTLKRWWKRLNEDKK